MTGLPFTPMAVIMDQVAIEGCITSGLIVIVEICKRDCYSIAGIVSAHTNVEEAFKAYAPHMMDNSFGIVIPREAGPVMFYSWLTYEELRNAASL